MKKLERFFCIWRLLSHFCVFGSNSYLSVQLLNFHIMPYRIPWYLPRGNITPKYHLGKFWKILHFPCESSCLHRGTETGCFIYDIIMFFLRVHRFHARIQSSTSTTYDKCLLESIMVVLSPKLSIQYNKIQFNII